MKSILFAVTNDLVYDQRMQRICNSLANHGYQVMLMGRKRSNSADLKNVAWKQKRIRCLFNRSFLFYAAYNLRLFFFGLFHRFHIYAAVDFDTLLPLTLVAKFYKARLVLDAHEYFTEVPELEGRNFVKKTWDKIGSYAIPQTALRYTVSDSLAIELESLYGKPFHTIKNLPNSSKPERNTNSPDRHSIIYQGAVNKGRGLELLLDVLQEINARLIIAGDGDRMDEIKKMVNEKKLNNKVKFTGFVLPDELKKLTNQATIGYNVLDPVSKSYNLSLSNKFFAYMQAGIPSISNDFPEYRKIINEYNTGVVCEFEHTSLKSALEKLINDENFYTKLKNNNIEASKKWQWKNEEPVLIKLFNEL